MPQGKPSDEYKILKDNIEDNFNFKIVKMKQYAAIEKAVLKQSQVAIHEETLRLMDTEHTAAINNMNDEYEKERLRIETTYKSQARKNTALAKLKEAHLDAQERAERAYLQNRKQEERALEQEKANAQKRVNEIAEKYADNLYNSLNLKEQFLLQQKKVAIKSEQVEELAAKKQTHDVIISQLQQEIETRKSSGEEYAELVIELEKYQQSSAQISADLSNAIKSETHEYEKQYELSSKIRAAQVAAVKSLDASGAGASRLLEEVESAKSEAEQQLEEVTVRLLSAAELKLDTAEIERLNETQRLLKDEVTDLTNTASELYKSASSDEYQKKHVAAMTKLEKTMARSTKDMVREKADSRKQEMVETDQEAEANWKYFSSTDGMKDEFGKVLANTVGNLANKLNDALNQIDSNINSFYAYQSSVEARLQGSDESFKSSLKTITKNVGLSGLVRQKDVIENIKKLSDAGIAYNLDLRAFLATISDDIANTFDVFDSNLMRLIRLQQSDTTVARLGMEASLNRLFNEYFSDTSYLTDAADSVSQAIIDANSQLTKDMSVEFEFMVQKWLGALYSLGMDQGTISTIAQGLNYLGTGNVEALNSNESLQSLLAMSASKAGISYADILTGGLDAETTNNLMKSMIEYLQSIAENTDNNQVTKSAYSNVFGFSISDLTAVSSLSTTDISNLHKQSLNYQGAMNEYEEQASQIFNRTHFSQMLDTVFDNAMMSASTAIGNNSGVYATWKVLNVIEDLTGGIAIPAISVMGNMVDLHQTVTGLAKTGIAGLSLMGSLLSSMFSGSLFGTMDAKSWGYEEFTSRGSSTKGISKGTASGLSQSSSMNMVGSSSSEDVKSSSLTDATADAEEDSKITNKNVEKEGDIYQKILDAIASDGSTVLEEVTSLKESLNTHVPSIIDSLSLTNDLLSESRIFRTEMSGLDSLKELLDFSRVFSTFVVNMPEIQAPENAISDTTAEAIDTAATVVSGSITRTADSVANSSAHRSSPNIDSIASLLSQSRVFDVSVVNFPESLTATNINSATNNTRNIDSQVASIQSYSASPSAASYTNVYEEQTQTHVTSPSYSSSPSAALAEYETAQISVTSAEIRLSETSKNVTSDMVQSSSDEQLTSMLASELSSSSILTTEGLKVSLSQLSPEVSSHIAETLRNVIVSSSSGKESNEEDATAVAAALLSDLLSTATLNVNVTNDNFDSAVQKIAFTS